jgi:hypothetical protein
MSTGRRSFLRKNISAAGAATLFGMLNASKAVDSFEEMAANLPESIQFQWKQHGNFFPVITVFIPEPVDQQFLFVS